MLLQWTARGFSKEWVSHYAHSECNSCCDLVGFLGLDLLSSVFFFPLPWVTICYPQEVGQIYLHLSRSACAVAFCRADGRRRMPAFVEVPTGHSPPIGLFPSFRKPALVHSHFYSDRCISSHPPSNIWGSRSHMPSAALAPPFRKVTCTSFGNLKYANQPERHFQWSTTGYYWAWNTAK